MPLDASVGVGFVVVALLARRATPAMRCWWALAGAAWWAGGAVPQLSVAHQGMLVGALATFPAGRPRTRMEGAALAGGVVAGSGYVTQLGAGSIFVLTALLVQGRRPVPRAAGVLVGGWLVGAFVWSRAWPASFSPPRALVGYELILLLVALGLPRALAADARRRASLTDRVVGQVPSGVAGLELTLRRVLHRPSISLRRNGDDVVVEGLGTADAETSHAVERALALTLAQEQSLDEIARRTRELESARTRLLAVSDVERRRAASRLGDGIVTLRSCSSQVTGPLADEFAAAVSDIESILAGLPPERLGGGRIAPVLEEMCARHPLPVALRCDPAAAADEAGETALFYVCSEALANTIKHSSAGRVRVSLDSGADVVLSVTDDGIGGADPGGAGLVGLRDRLAAVGGQLHIGSPVGRGTRVVARVPRVRPPMVTRSARTA